MKQQNSAEPMNTGEEQTKKKKNLLWLWVLLLLLLVCAGVTVALLGSKLSEKADSDDEVIALVPEEASGGEGDSQEKTKENADAETPSNDLSDADSGTSSDGGTSAKSGIRKTSGLGETLYAQLVTEDKKQVWSSETHVDIFSDHYYGSWDERTEHDVTVENGTDDGMNVIAPGTEGYYTFWIKNTGDVPMDYQLSFWSRQNYDYDIPVEFRLKSGDTYIFGDGHNWMPWEDLNKAGEGKMLPAKNYARYTLEWRWAFRGDNEHDTWLGNRAKYQDIRQDVVIYTTGTVSEGYEGAYRLFGVQTGDMTNILLWIILAAAALSAIFLLLYIRRKKEEDAE